MNDERHPASLGGRCDRDRDLPLCRRAVAPEVAGDEQRVGLTRVEQQPNDVLERPDVLFGAAGEVDGVLRRRSLRQDRREVGSEARRQQRELQSVPRCNVGRNDAVSPTVADHGQATPSRRAAVQKGLRRVDELAWRRDSYDPGRAARRVDDREVGDERARMRPRGPDAGLASSAAQQHDRLAGGRCGTSKSASVSEVLDVERDQPRGVMAGEALDQLSRFEIRLVPKRRKAREAEPFTLGEQRELERQVAALGDQADLTEGKVDPRRQVELLVAVEDAEAVGAEQDGSGLPHALAERALRRLPQAGADADDRPGAGGERVVDGLLEGGRGDAGDHELRRVGQVAERPVGRTAEDLAAVPVDEADGTAVAALQRAARQQSAPFSRVARGADDRDRPGSKEGIEAPAPRLARMELLQHANKHRTMSP
jgi:hypothetical protein